MALNYPIWHKVTACIYKSSKSYGGRDDSGETIYVGTSAKHSYKHCQIVTTRRTVTHPKFGECYSFRTMVDGIALKETLVRTKDKQMVQQRTKLNKIKPLIKLV